MIPNSKSILTPTIRKILTAASRRQDGSLPGDVTAVTLSRIVEAGWAEVPAGGTRPAITTSGRRAILSRPQLIALTTASADDRLAPSAVWQTSRSLGALLLVHFWDDKTGSFHTTDGDNGTSRPTRRPYRTELGRQVAELGQRKRV